MSLLTCHIVERTSAVACVVEFSSIEPHTLQLAYNLALGRPPFEPFLSHEPNLRDNDHDDQNSYGPGHAIKLLSLAVLGQYITVT